MTKKAHVGFVSALVALWLLGGAVHAEEWWTRPWDHKVAPNKDRGRGWYLESVNDLGGTPEEDNQRDISKSLGRIRKFRAQALFRIRELREMKELAAMGGGYASGTAAKASPLFRKAEGLVKQAISLQKDNKFDQANRLLLETKKLLNQGETIMETAIAAMADRRHLQHLRHAVIHAEMPELSEEIDLLAGRIEKAAVARVSDLKAAVAEQQEMIDLLKSKLPAAKAKRQYSDEFRYCLDLYQYLLDSVSKGGEKTQVYDGEKIALDAVHPDLELGVVGSVARRVELLRFKLRQLSNRMSALTRSAVTKSISDRISAKLGFPIDDLDHFTRSQFGWVNTNRLIENDAWEWEFNYTPKDADAISIAGRWRFQTDPESVGHTEGWFKPEFDTRGWRNIYAPAWWEREGVVDYNSADNVWAAHKMVTGQKFNESLWRGRQRQEHRHYNGVAWYRKTVHVPQRWKGSDILLRCGVLGGTFRFYVNGRPADGKWQQGGWGLKDLTIPAGAVRFGRTNQIDICCYNRTGPGGLAEGPLWLVRSGGSATFRRTPFGAGYVREETYGSAGGPFRVNLIQSAMSPGVVLATDSKAFHMWGWSMKGYAGPTEAVFSGEKGPQTVKLDKSREIAAGAAMRENWLLLKVGKGHGRPVVLVFQHRPSSIAWSADAFREGLTAEFPGSVGQVGIVHAGENGAPAGALVKSARFWSQAMLAYPVAASEFWKVDPGRKPGHFQLMGTFDLFYGFHKIKDDWGTRPLETAGLPTLYSLALDYKYPGFAETEARKTGVFSSYGTYARSEFRTKVGGSRLSYAAPCADHANLWKGIGTLFKGEVLRKNKAGFWSVTQTKKWGSNNDRFGLAMHAKWDIPLQNGFGGELFPSDHENWKLVDGIVNDHVENKLPLILLYFGSQAAGFPRRNRGAIPGHARLWHQIAQRYKKVSPDLLIYNFINEPAYIDPEMYNKLIATVTDAVRDMDEDKWITHDMGDGWAQPNWMFGTEPTGDPKTVYQYHFYYKHDGIIEGRSPEQFYPQWGEGWPFYYMNSRERYLEEILDTLVYQTVHHVPVWCGEFGGSINNPNQEALLWTEDHIGAMERMGHGWSWWNWSGRGYGRTGLQDGDMVSPVVLVLKRFMHRKGIF